MEQVFSGSSGQPATQNSVEAGTAGIGGKLALDGGFGHGPSSRPVTHTPATVSKPCERRDDGRHEEKGEERPQDRVNENLLHPIREHVPSLHKAPKHTPWVTGWQSLEIR